MHLATRGLRPLGRRRAARRPRRARRPRLARRTCRAASSSTTASTGATTRRPQVPWTETRDLRGARAQPDPAATRRARGAARHVRRAGPPRVARAPDRPRRHRRSSCCRCTPSPPSRPWSSAGLIEPLGLQHARLLRPARRRTPPRADPQGVARRVQGHGQGCCTRAGHRGHPRRRLQPHREQGRDGATLSLARPGQPRLLPARRARPATSTSPAAATPWTCATRVVCRHGARLAALLGAASATSTASASTSPSRWPAAATTATTPTTRSSWRCAPTRCCPGSSSSPSRGTSACTAGAPASSRRRSPSGTTATATRCAPSGCADVGPVRARPARPRRARAGDPAGRLAGPVRRPRPRPARLGQLRRGPRRLHPRRPDGLRRASTTRPTARATATATTTTGRGTTASRARPTTRTCCAARRRSMRNLLGTLLLSTGVPMLNAGDEIGRTQGGNNNAYCQDNEISWLDWDLDRGSARPARDHPPPAAAARATHPVLRQRDLLRRSPGPRRTARPTWRGSPPTASRWTTAAGTTRTRGPLRHAPRRRLREEPPRCSSSCTATPWTRGDAARRCAG